MEQEDPKRELTVESIMERLVKSLVGEDYGEAEYWENRYKAEEEQYEWFLPWSQTIEFIEKYVREAHIALNLGCGNSRMSEEMLNSGIDCVMSIDISPTVIDQMKRKYEKQPKLKWQVMDCSKLDFDDESFDLVVDKGTLDALYCSSSSKEIVPKTLSEIRRVLKKNGFFIDISFGSPASRTQLTTFDSLVLVTVIEISNPRCQSRLNYAYVFKK